MRYLNALSIIVTTCIGASTAMAEERLLENPPLLPLIAPQADARPQTLLKRAAPLARDAGEIVYDLSVEYVDAKLWNPATNRHDPVSLRGFKGEGMNPDRPLVSPTIEMRPGQTVRMTLRNKLDMDPSCIEHGAVNDPHCFNGTNMHTHGLWINPAGNSDNVLISINPGVDFTYEYNVPADHPAGTFWYHPHRHGSTALQVSSGMAGALVIRGDRAPTATTNGDLDVLLAPSGNQAFRERVMVFQQIAYACLNKDGTINRDGKDGPYICDEGQVGVIENYDGFGPGDWTKSGRYTSINGQILPRWTMEAGQIERWRMVHAGVRDTISLQLVKAVASVDTSEQIPSDGREAFIARTCGTEAIDYHTIAADGLTMAAANRVDTTVFQPGYRWDGLVTLNEPGIYCVLDAATGDRNIDLSNPTPALLAFVEVTGTRTGSGDVGDYVKSALVAAAQQNLPRDIAPVVVADLEDGVKLSKFEPHVSLMGLDADDLGKQTLHFNIDVTTDPNKAVFEVDGKPFDAHRVDRTLELGKIDQWEIYSDFVSHPFHIHVNPFQVLAILDPTGKDVSAPGAIDDYNANDPSKPLPPEKADKNFPGLKGVWKDTLWIKNALASNDPNVFPKGQYKIIVRTHYQRYIGDFVLHCHILDHEDQGMMQHIRIALPDGMGGIADGAHGGTGKHVKH